MSDQVRIYRNGAYYSVDDFEGPTDEQVSVAYKRKSQRDRCGLRIYALMADTGIQSSSSGSPKSLRMVKHRGTTVEGIRVK
jgi:hypothetical protein